MSDNNGKSVSVMEAPSNDAFKRVPLGSGRELLVMMHRLIEDGLGVYGEGDIALPSSRSAESALRTLLKKMPVPSMHPWYDDILNHINDDRKVRISNLVGPPGIGKSTLGAVLADAMGVDCKLINCGYKITSEFIKETTVNGHKFLDDFTAVEERLNEGALSKPSLRLLLARLGKDAIVANGKGGHYTDWDKISEDKLEAAAAAVRQVAELEGMGRQQGGVGITTQNGELLEALLDAIKQKKPTVIILDEFSRRRGDGGAMQRLYEVMAGYEDECVVEGGHGKKYTIRNQDLREAGVYVVLTSNPKTPDEPDVKELPGALQSRLTTIPMPTFSAQDYQHSFERALALPISTLYLAQKDDFWEKDPTAFGQHLQRVHEMGMTEEEKSRIPEYERSFIANWSKFTQASQQIGEFFHEWQQVNNPESALYAGGKLGDVQQEIFRIKEDKTHPATDIAVDNRLLLKVIEDAWNQRAEPRRAKDATPGNKSRKDRYPEEHFGDRFVKELNVLVSRVYPDPHSEVRKHLERKMAELGLLPAGKAHELKQDAGKDGKKTVDQRASGGGRKSVAELLNTNRQLAVSEETRQWRDIFVEHLKEKYPEDIAADAPPQSVLPDTGVAKALETLPQELKERLKEIGMVVSSIPLVELGFEGKNMGVSITGGAVIDLQGYDGEGKGLPKEAHDLIERQVQERMSKGRSPAPDAKRLLMTLAIPGAAQAMQPYLFTQGFSASDHGHKNSDEIKVAEGCSDTGLAITSINAGKGPDGADGLLHIVRQGDDTLIVGSVKINANLEKFLRQQNITYVDRHRPDAKDIIQGELDRMTAAGLERARRTAAKGGMAEEAARAHAERLDYPRLMHRAFRTRMKPTEALIEQAARNAKVPKEKLVEETDMFKDLTLPDLLLDDGKLVQPEWPVVLLEADLKSIPASPRVRAVMEEKAADPGRAKS